MHSFEEELLFETMPPADGDLSDMSADEASQDLADLLIDLKMRNKLSAKDVCIIAYLGKKAGLTGAATTLAYNPNAPTGHFNRHLKRVLHIDENLEDSYELELPICDKHTGERVTLKHPAMAAHECLVDEVAGKPELEAQLRHAIADGSLSEAYFQHEVVQQATGEDVWPYAVYVDGVSFTRRDSLIGFWAYNMVSNSRHLLLVLRRSQLCACGCGGWCTLSGVWHFLSWCFGSLATGRWPKRRHDDSAFGASDERRQMLANNGGHFPKFALVHVKGDWAEMVHTFGLQSWNTLFHPCFCCHVIRDHLGVSGDVSPVSSPYREKTAADYEEACSACEILVEVANVRVQAELAGLLFYDKRQKGGYHGRALRGAYPALGLRMGDRLEPNPMLPDIANFEAQSPPFTAMFWRHTNDTLAKHRCLLFSTPGVSIRSLSIDALHTLHLGVWKNFCCSAMWQCIEADAWNVGSNHADVRESLSVQRLRSDLFAWYAAQKERRPGKELYELGDLTLKMLGSRTHHALATKAAETGTLLEFCTSLVHKHVERLGAAGPALVRVGDALVRMKKIMRSSGVRMAPDHCQELIDCAKRALALREAARIPLKPKWHLMLHLLGQAFRKGNPKSYSTFVDESLNGVLAKLAAGCHSLTWHRSVLAHFWVQKMTGARRAKRSRT